MCWMFVAKRNRLYSVSSYLDKVPSLCMPPCHHLWPTQFHPLEPKNTSAEAEPKKLMLKNRGDESEGKTFLSALDVLRSLVRDIKQSLVVICDILLQLSTPYSETVSSRA